MSSFRLVTWVFVAVAVAGCSSAPSVSSSSPYGRTPPASVSSAQPATSKAAPGASEGVSPVTGGLAGQWPLDMTPWRQVAGQVTKAGVKPSKVEFHALVTSVAVGARGYAEA